ncbi:DsbA family oxidoreductase [Porphyromonas levii]|uniref:DSBA-like thioredoxin domain-containing protein n=1 Tax=Porphyromonas levii TaxID=28114 RepID=A0A4Y8WTQ8_9PORP|nr:DsbA family protein [Porphyromonas levii]TFH96592.1 hypothetical protein E4P48_04350 [Porphyromonas levii]TFH97439.1 hypothetical protein E4P47_00345 [Porphyromonas levii]
MTKKIIVEIWADITCPFCYIGETLLQRELEQWVHADMVDVRWRSSLLSPQLPLEKSFTWTETVARIKAPEQLALFQKKTEVLKRLSEKYGLAYNLETAYSHNAQRAARLLKAAGEFGLTLRLANLFGRGYFSEGKDYSKPEELRNTALEAGLPKEVIDNVLHGDLYLAEVEADQVLAEKYTPNYVPTIYFNGSEMIEGILKPDQLRRSLEMAWKKL